MKKKLIILLYRIDVGGLTRQQAEQQLGALMDEYSLRDDNELKEHYIIREIWLPININGSGGGSDVNVIYPITVQQTSPQLNDLIDEISARIKDHPDSTLNHHWTKIIRELKLKKLEE
jgi:hypothetical protein